MRFTSSGSSFSPASASAPGAALVPTPPAHPLALSFCALFASTAAKLFLLLRRRRLCLCHCLRLCPCPSPSPCPCPCHRHWARICRISVYIINLLTTFCRRRDLGHQLHQRRQRRLASSACGWHFCCMFFLFLSVYLVVVFVCRHRHRPGHLAVPVDKRRRKKIGQQPQPQSLPQQAFELSSAFAFPQFINFNLDVTAKQSRVKQSRATPSQAKTSQAQHILCRSGKCRLHLLPPPAPPPAPLHHFLAT